MNARFLGGLLLAISAPATMARPEVPVGPEGLEVAAHFDFITSLAFSPNGRILAAGSLDETISLWEPTERERLGCFQAHKGGVFGLAFSPDAKTLASVGADHLVRLWDVTSRKLIRELRGHSDKVACVVFSPDGMLLATGGYDKHIRFWDPATGRELRRLKGHDGRVTALAFSPDGKLVASGGTGEAVIRLPRGTEFNLGQDDFVRLWSVSSGKELKKLSLRGSSLAFDPEGKTLAIGGATLLDIREIAGGGTELNGLSLMTLLEFTTGSTQMQIRHGGTAVTFSADSWLMGLGMGTRQHVAGGVLGGGPEVLDVDQRLHLYERVSGQRVLSLPRCVNPVIISPNGNLLVAADHYNRRRYKGYLHFWDLARDGLDPGAWLQPKDLGHRDLLELLEQLGGEDAPMAYRAVCTLILADGKATAFLKSRVMPVRNADGARVEKLISSLDDEEFTVRDAAAGELKTYLPLFEPALSQAHEAADSAQVRRALESLLRKAQSPRADGNLLRALRTIQVLERIGSEEAQHILMELANGAPLAVPTLAARRALGRLERRVAAQRRHE